MKKLLLTAVTCGLLVSSCPAFAGCTEEEVEKKANEFMMARAAFVRNHPDKAAEVQAKIENVTKRHIIGDVSGDPGGMCKIYDVMMVVVISRAAIQ